MRLQLTYLQLRLFVMLIAISVSAFACTQSKQTTSGVKQVIKNSEADISSMARLSGVDLIATGDQPVSWRLEMDFDKEFRFMNAHADSLVTTAVKPVFDAYEKKDVFKMNINQGTMEISLYRELCKNRGKKLFRVSVKTPQAMYTGCYEYRDNKMLQGNWNLELIDDKPVAEFSPQATPTISIDLSTGKMKGFDGCNTINTDLSVQGDRLLFAPLLSTKKFCDGNKTGEIFIRWVSDRLVNYTLTDEILTLYLGNDSRLVFRRAR